MNNVRIFIKKTCLINEFMNFIKLHIKKKQEISHWDFPDFFKRKVRDSNPRYPKGVYRISSPARSITLPTFLFTPYTHTCERCVAESNRSIRFCRPSHNRFVNAPFSFANAKVIIFFWIIQIFCTIFYHCGSFFGFSSYLCWSYACQKSVEWS